MKIIKQAGNTTIKLSKAEWKSIGKTAGWAEEWGDDAFVDEEEEEDDILDDILDEKPEPSELDPKLMKEIEMIEREVEEELGDETAPIPEEVRREQRLMNKKDPATWEAERSERAEEKRREDTIRDQRKREKGWEKQVWTQPPVE